MLRSIQSVDERRNNVFRRIMNRSPGVEELKLLNAKSSCDFSAQSSRGSTVHVSNLQKTIIRIENIYLKRIAADVFGAVGCDEQAIQILPHLAN